MNDAESTRSCVNRLGFPRMTGVPEFARLGSSRRAEVVHLVRVRMNRWKLILCPGFAALVGLMVAFALWLAVAIALGDLVEPMRGVSRVRVDDILSVADVVLGLALVGHIPFLAGAWVDHFIMKKGIIRTPTSDVVARAGTL